MKINLVSLGCARNLVDSEIMLGDFSDAGWEIVPDPAMADVIVVNTCSFIESAVEESIDTILELAAYKESGRCRRLVVAGCLPERFRENLAESLPEVDIFLGTGAYDQIMIAVQDSLEKETRACLLPDPDAMDIRKGSPKRVPTSYPTAYLKIAEGCSKHCTYCIIPKLRGSHRSRWKGHIIEEARTLVTAGIRELVLVAQDTTAYGVDLKPPAGLADLLSDLAAMDSGLWIRFLYGHPESIQDRVLQVVADHPNICAYFDIPIQHSSNPVLKRMGRGYTKDDLKRLFDRIRKRMPDAALRTTVMVGFPGESETDFKSLMDFIQEIRFDHLGVFTYSDAEELPAHHLPDHVKARIARDRQDILMACQADISLAKNRSRIGRNFTVLIEGRNEDGSPFGRTYFQAPEVDGLTYVHSPQLSPGDFVEVAITEAFDYDVIGEPLCVT